ncbi:hypothetical protein ES288_D05G170300v1 [Gossypium darwinii]|uniref:DOG1 domain-containing protein n=1 Tax=Gossypium darwinii TaxID=34276 RepID=A0A5D2CKF8_GOSDA|nr:hypothetical protein ES288_D05G170300v1 [Gossypium darwinii]
MIDPTLESLKDDELEVICDVINECIQIDARQRPTMKALNQNENDGNLTDNTCAQLVERSLDSFLEYIEQRAQLDISGLFSPSWNTALENSLPFITGCRPSPYIRLTYALCGSQVEYQLSEIIQGLARGNLGQILATQLRMINNLHIKTIEEEEKLSSQLAGLQENIADQPIAMVAKRMSRVGESSGNVDHALDELESSMANILQEADKLRLSTLKELLAILTPLQGVDFLVASKKLHLCMHKWGKTRDNRQLFCMYVTMHI